MNVTKDVAGKSSPSHTHVLSWVSSNQVPGMIRHCKRRGINIAAVSPLVLYLHKGEGIARYAIISIIKTRHAPIQQNNFDFDPPMGGSLAFTLHEFLMRVNFPPGGANSQRKFHRLPKLVCVTIRSLCGAIMISRECNILPSKVMYVS
jgi:hypothetical protein